MTHPKPVFDNRARKSIKSRMMVTRKKPDRRPVTARIQEQGQKYHVCSGRETGFDG